MYRQTLLSNGATIDYSKQMLKGGKQSNFKSIFGKKKSFVLQSPHNVLLNLSQVRRGSVQMPERQIQKKGVKFEELKSKNHSFYPHEKSGNIKTLQLPD